MVEPDVARRGAAIAAAVSAATVGGLFALSGDVGLDLADEGFLWHGVQLTLDGRLPIRDFQSYDPGRYAWCALWAWLLGDDGVMAVRKGAAVFQALGLFLGLLAARRAVGASPWLVPVGVGLALWSFPRHKLFESSLAMAAVYVGVRLLEARSVRWHAIAGAFAGVAAVFGRNHGVYATVGLAAPILLAHIRCREGPLAPRLAAFAGGVAAGYTPVLGLALFADGFAERFVENVLFLLESGRSLPRPIPWPWRIEYGEVRFGTAWGAFAVGVGFVLPFGVVAAGLLRALLPGWQPRRDALLTAGSALGLAYLHHAVSRADPNHLAQAIHPTLLAALALPLSYGVRRRAPVAVGAALLALLTLGVSLNANQAVSRFRPGASRALVERELGDDTLRLPPGSARYLGRILAVLERHVPADATLYVGPAAPTFYALSGHTAPLWELYGAWRLDAVREAHMVRAFEHAGVDHVLIVDAPARYEPRLAFRFTHPRLNAHLRRHFEAVPGAGLPKWHHLLRCKQP